MVQKRLSLILVFVLYSAEFSARAHYSNSGPPSKLASCHIAMAGPQRRLSSNSTFLSSLRDFRFKLFSSRSFAKGIFHRLIRPGSAPSVNFFLRGNIHRLNESALARIGNHVNSMEFDITHNHNPDIQFFTSEFRGENVTRALEMMVEFENLVQEHYRGERERFLETHQLSDSFTRRVIDVVAGTGLLFKGLIPGMGLKLFFLLIPVAIDLPIEFVFTVAGLYAASPFYMAHRFDRKRLDLTYFELKEFLSRVQLDESRENILVSSHSFNVPVELHQFFMRPASNDGPLAPQQDEASNQGLFNATDGGELGFFDYRYLNFDRVMESATKRLLDHQNAPYRRVQVDHIVYFDEEAHEPVWLSLYRSKKELPSSMGGSKKEDSTTRPLDFDRVDLGIPNLAPVAGH